jgi:hypothetical protein
MIVTCVASHNVAHHDFVERSVPSARVTVIDANVRGIL